MKQWIRNKEANSVIGTFNFLCSTYSFQNTNGETQEMFILGYKD